MRRAIPPAFLILTLWAAAWPGELAAQASSAASATPAVVPFVSNLTRLESWSFFEPRPGGGDPDYAFVANRLRFGVRLDAERYEVLGALQYVQFGGLPRAANGPGPLGTGALYFSHAGRTDSRQLYLRYLNVRLKELAPGFSLQVGRMPYHTGAETVSPDGKIEAVKRMRLHSRLIGEFEWSIYQRAFDGVRADYDRPSWHVTAAAMRPTQGGFEQASGLTLDDVDLLAGTLVLRPGAVAPRTEVQAFVYRYDDGRPVAARPDNTGRRASVVDVQVNSFGTALTGAYPAGAGEADGLLWVVGQTGNWFGERHRAYAVAAEGGYQWKGRWQPWVRGGVLRASGDPDPTDSRHGTFFQMVPTVRKYSLSASYSQMNLVDLFGQLLLRPRPGLAIRADVHRVGLAERADLWYAGSGATRETGTFFGYGGRGSGGATSLGTVVEGSVDYAINPHWSINGYVGRIVAGDVVKRLFAGDRLTFAYVEHVVQF